VLYTRIYAGPDGESHFAEAEIELAEVVYAPPAPPFLVSELFPVSAIAVTTIPAGWHGDWHPTPRLQWWFHMAGELELHTSDGGIRRFGPGSIIRVEDLTGRGHTTTVISAEPVVGVHVHILPEA
jgi:hypothetical protein